MQCDVVFNCETVICATVMHKVLSVMECEEESLEDEKYQLHPYRLTMCETSIK